jgi:putative redox protein
MDIKLDWKHGLQFNGMNDSGVIIPVGTQQDDDPDFGGFKPLELILVGLAGCTAMDVVSILEKKRQVVTRFSVNVHADRAEDHPRVFTEIVVEYIFAGDNLDHAAVQRSVELSETKYCSAMAMLRKNSPIISKITILPNG